MPTIWISLLKFCTAARKTMRPMRPKPLIPTLIILAIPSFWFRGITDCSVFGKYTAFFQKVKPNRSARHGKPGDAPPADPPPATFRRRGGTALFPVRRSIPAILLIHVHFDLYIPPRRWGAHRRSWPAIRDTPVCGWRTFVAQVRQNGTHHRDNPGGFALASSKKRVGTGSAYFSGVRFLKLSFLHGGIES